MIKVLLILRGFEADGPGRLVLSLMKAWNPDELEVSIFALEKKGPLKEAFKDEVARLNGEVRCVKHDNFAAILGKIRTDIPKWVQSFDVIHAHLLRSDFLGRRLASLCKLPYLVTEHGLHAWSEKGKYLKPLVKRWYRTSLPENSKIVAISELCRGELLQEGIDASQIEVVENGIDMSLFSGLGETPPCTNDTLKILVAGSLIARKRPELALRAFMYLRKVKPGSQLVYAGDGPLKETLENLTSQMNLEDSVQFAGQVDQMPDLMRQSDLLLHVAEKEPFGLVLAEALSCGLPVVAAAEAGSGDLLPAYPRSLLVEGSNPQVWARSILDLHSHWEKNNQNSELSIPQREFSKQRYDIHICAKKYRDLYKDLTGQSGRVTS